MNKLIVLFFSMMALAVSCSKKDEQGTQEVQSSNVAATAEVSEVAKCSNGKEAKILSGSCSGSWTWSQDGGCIFTWGPAIKCPEGMKGQKYETVCYGALNKVTQKSNDSQSCSEEFGNPPSKVDYELICCEE